MLKELAHAHSKLGPKLRATGLQFAMLALTLCSGF